MSKKPRIVLLHGTPVAVEPIQKSFASRWPGAETVNLLDDSLSVDRAKDPDLTDRMFERFIELGGYARRIGADAILVTCSAFGPAIERMARDVGVPVLKPNEAMIAEALKHGRRIGLVATFAPTFASMRPEFAAAAPHVELVTAHAAGAMEALAAGDAATHDSRIAAAAATLRHCDVIALAQFSMARAREAATAASGRTVLTTPDNAVLALKARLKNHS